MDSFGEYLKRERELRGVTLEEIVNATNISTSLLIAIENDDYSELPAEVFVKGFIRSYAKCIGTDPNEVVLAYEEWIVRAKNKGEGDKRVDFFKKGEWKERVSWKLTIVILAGVIILIGIILYVRGGDEAQKHISKEQLLARERVIVKSSAPVEKEEERDEIGNVSEKDMMVLTVIALEDAWFRVQIDDAQVRDFILPKGGSEDLQAKEKFVITIGNKKGTSLRLNGKEIALPSTNYNVVRNFILTQEEVDRK